jgi:hypothetical protein
MCFKCLNVLRLHITLRKIFAFRTHCIGKAFKVRQHYPCLACAHASVSGRGVHGRVLVTARPEFFLSCIESNTKTGHLYASISVWR